MADGGTDDDAGIPIGAAALMVIGLLVLGAVIGVTIDWFLAAPDRTVISTERESP